MNHYAQTTQGHTMNHNGPAFTNHNQQQQSAQRQSGQGLAFTLDETSAEQAGAPLAITETGAYVVTIQRATYRLNGTGSHALNLKFHDADGNTGWVSLTYAKATGEPTFGAHFINAMLYLLGLPGFTWAPAIDEHGRPITDQNQQVMEAPEFKNKTIGLFVRKTKNQNDDGTHLELAQVFEPNSQCTASEAKNGLAPEDIAKRLKALAA